MVGVVFGSANTAYAATLTPADERYHVAFPYNDMEYYVGVAGLDASESFRRFCGSRYGREPLSELYADYLEVAGGALRAAQARRESRAARSTGSGGSGAYEALNARQQSELDAWNRAFPQMKMSAREYLSRNK